MHTTLVYITTENMDEAKNVGRILLEERLAAGVNIIDHVHSMYWWEGEIQDDREVVLIAKTRESLIPDLTEKVKSIHSYDCPCIVSLPILDGSQAFLDWVLEETK